MGLETATYLSDLVSTNPLSTDKKKQGDDHLRLIKAALQATFPNASRAWRMPDFASKTVTGAIAPADENKTLLCDTSGGTFTLTLPSPAFAGWTVTVMKTTTDANVVFVAPPGGNINTNVGAVAKIRVSTAFKEYKFVWTGSAFIEFDCMEEPGTILNFYGASAPVGYTFVYGQTLSGTSADYPQLYARRASLVMPDLRGRVEFGKDNMGSDAGRLTTAGGGIDGDTLEAVGSTESFAIAQENLPAVNFTGSNTLPIKYTPTAANLTGNATNLVNQLGAGGLTANTEAGTITVSSGGSGVALKRVPPGIVCNKILRLC